MRNQDEAKAAIDSAIKKMDSIVKTYVDRGDLENASNATAVVVLLHGNKSALDNEKFKEINKELDDAISVLDRARETAAETQNQVEAIAAAAGLIQRAIALV